MSVSVAGRSAAVTGAAFASAGRDELCRSEFAMPGARDLTVGEEVELRHKLSLSFKPVL